MTASPISDLNPIFMACESEATFKLHSRGERTIVMDQSFFPSYRKTAAEKGEVLLHVKLPFCQKVNRNHHSPESDHPHLQFFEAGNYFLGSWECSWETITFYVQSAEPQGQGAE